MRRLLALTTLLTVALGGTPAVAFAQPANASLTPQQALTTALSSDMTKLGRDSGALVIDMNTGKSLYANASTVARTPASVEKLYTTSVALLKYGPNATLKTKLLGVGTQSTSGAWSGTLYLHGGGDPTLGTMSFDQTAYGTGATLHDLVTGWQHGSGVSSVAGRIVGDESLFDARRGTIESNYKFDPYMEGSLSALAVNRGLTPGGTSALANPPLSAASLLIKALGAAHIKLSGVSAGAGVTPARARLLATVASPPMSRITALTNGPSDNFFAETLAKDLGAYFGAGGTTAAGVGVIRAQLARLGLAPHFDDGSGLSYDDATSPQQVVTLLRAMANNGAFVGSLPIGGETGTLAGEMKDTPAQGNCRAKTGTLRTVASLAGYCQGADGHTLVFAVLANQLANSAVGHSLEADMAVAMANYAG